MKKPLIIVLVLVCVLALAGLLIFLTQEEDHYIFKTEDIVSVTFYHDSSGDKPYPVPEEDLPEIVAWLGTFRTAQKVRFFNGYPELAAGTNSFWVEITYADGQVLKTVMDTATVEGVLYHTTDAGTPESFNRLFLDED